MARTEITGNDCRSCGACCIGGDEGDGWADCTTEDVMRMTRQARAQLVPTSPGWAHTDRWYATPTVMTDTGGACAFLRGTPGKRVTCRIYETRPEVCRDFRPGSRGCREKRREIGLPS
jgi:Fe-S-cluster containining protein